jgi:hypothetical protein
MGTSAHDSECINRSTAHAPDCYRCTLSIHHRYSKSHIEMRRPIASNDVCTDVEHALNWFDRRHGSTDLHVDDTRPDDKLISSKRGLE